MNLKDELKTINPYEHSKELQARRDLNDRRHDETTKTLVELSNQLNEIKKLVEKKISKDGSVKRHCFYQLNALKTQLSFFLTHLLSCMRKTSSSERK